MTIRKWLSIFTFIVKLKDLGLIYDLDYISNHIWCYINLQLIYTPKLTCFSFQKFGSKGTQLIHNKTHILYQSIHIILCCIGLIVLIPINSNLYPICTSLLLLSINSYFDLKLSDLLPLISYLSVFKLLNFLVLFLVLFYWLVLLVTLEVLFAF